MITVTALGTGVAATHYNLDADCCRKAPGFLVEYDGFRLLFDCSQDIAFRLGARGIPPESITTIALSHSHQDHNALMHYLQTVYCGPLWGAQKPEVLNLILPSNMYPREKLLEHWQCYLPKAQDFFSYPQLELFSAEQPEPVQLPGGAMIYSFPTYHDFGETPAYCFRFEYEGKVITYSGDTGLSPGLDAAALNADLFICEASSRISDRAAAIAPTGYGHLSPFHAGSVARRANVTELLLTHYTGLDSVAEMIDDSQASGFKGVTIIGNDAWKTTLI